MALADSFSRMVRITMQMFSRLCLLAPLVAVCLFAGCQSAETPSNASHTGRGSAIVETMDAGGYTYVKLVSDAGEVWYAVPQCEVAVGERVEVADGAMAMRNFESRALKRTFPVIYFASGLEQMR